MRSEAKDFSRSGVQDLPLHACKPSGPWSFIVTGIFLSALACTRPALAEDPSFDRPGYGFAPGVLRAGDITIEQGLPDWQRDRSQGVTSSQYSADTLLRIGLGGSLEAQLSGSPWNSLREQGAGVDSIRHGHGDTQLGLKLALPSGNSDFTWGLLGSMEFNDGDKDFRADRRQYLLAAQLNLQVNEQHSLGMYLEDVRSGGRDTTTAAFGDSVKLSQTFALYVETAWLHSPDQGAGVVAGGGVTWTPITRLQFDAGFDRRVGGMAPEWQANLGVSMYFAR